jgi:hypothetical protein
MRAFSRLTLAIVLMSLLMALLPASVIKADEIVVFPDPNLEAAVREAIGKPSGDIYQSDLVGLIGLSATARSIKNLTGLEHCTSLRSLVLYDNYISDLSPLSSLTSLTYLHLQVNQISDISPLSSLTSLTQLYLGTNRISDISPLSSLTSLTCLNLGTNRISDISPLSSLTSLTQLYLYFNHISDLSPLSGLTSLTHLYLSNNRISDISPLSSLTSLTELILMNELSLMGNQISDIKPLVDNPGLSRGDFVYLQGNPLSNTSIYIYIPQLQARGVTVYYDVLPPSTYVATATGTGTAAFTSSSGTIENLSAVAESSLPSEGKPDLTFPHGFFSFDVTGLTPGATVAMTITLPSAMSVGTQYWKYGTPSSNATDHWYRLSMEDDDGDNFIIIALVDGGLGDDDLTTNGVIVDQGGPGNPPTPAGAGVSVPLGLYIGIAAALGASIAAYFVRRRLISQR